MTKINPALKASDDAAAAVQKTPNRVTLESLYDKIATVEYYNPEAVPHMTIAIVVLKNGFVVTGESAPADPENFDLELGKELAHKAAVVKIWPLEGYVLRERLSQTEG